MGKYLHPSYVELDGLALHLLLDHLQQLQLNGVVLLWHCAGDMGTWGKIFIMITRDESMYVNTWVLVLPYGIADHKVFLFQNMVRKGGKLLVDFYEGIPVVLSELELADTCEFLK